MSSETNVQSLIDAFLAEAREAPLPNQNIVSDLDLSSYPSGQAILALPREGQAAVVLEVVDRLASGRYACAAQAFVGIVQPGMVQRAFASLSAIVGTGLRPSGKAEAYWDSAALLKALLPRKLPYTGPDVQRLVRATCRGMTSRCGVTQPANIVRIVERFVDDHGMPPGVRAAVTELAGNLRAEAAYTIPHKLLRRIDSLLERTGDPGAAVTRQPPAVKLVTEEAWTRFLRSALERFDADGCLRWNTLLSHCATASTSKASKKWLLLAKSLMDAVGTDTFMATIVPLLGEIGKAGEPGPPRYNGMGYPPDPTQIHDTHSDLLRGLIWCTAIPDDDVLAGKLGDAAEVCFKKIPGIGPRAPKIGNACLWALAQRASPNAVAQLSRLKSKARHASVRTQLNKALGTTSENAGMSPEELEETAVPTCGFTSVGECRREFGDVIASVRVAENAKLRVSWIKPDSKSQSSVPAAVREGFGQALKALKQSEREATKLLSAQRDRLERLFLQERSWPLADFRTRYLDHPLVGVHARRLIWIFSADNQVADGMWHDGRIVDEEGRPLDWLGEGTRVAPWHPLHAHVERVQAWRTWLETREIRQPFKQAHREIYLLTDAERHTEVYSNRFAAHIIRQHQFAALCHERGWRYHLQGAWDSANTPSLDLPRWDLRAEFWVQSLSDAPVAPGDDSTSPSGIYLHVSTDQVRFLRLGRDLRQGPGAETVPLSEVPPLVFSEVMRDLDLFVGVASIGNDPTWADGGQVGAFGTYWHQYAFGELSATAATRKAVLERLIPRLKIAGRCSITDRFLFVRGDLRTYKIHLGSGNVQMEPDNQYLCIVPSPSGQKRAAGNVFLPFEGDNVLSIILSKALLLASDREIKDPTILSQIGARRQHAPR